MRVTLILGLAFIIPFFSAAQSGTIDNSFGIGGITRLDYDGPTNSSAANDVMIMPDNSILLLGGFGSKQFFVKLSADGHIDNFFGNNGFKVTNIANVSDGVGMIMQPDGKIITGASRSNASTHHDFIAMRYDWYGRLDPTFGNGGIAEAIQFGQDYCSAIALQSDGKILLAGRSGNNITLVRFDADGLLDNGFGTGGKVTTLFQGYGARPCKLFLLQDGKIVMVGSWTTGNGSTGSDIILVRYMPDGTLDTGFGYGGISQAKLVGEQTARAAVILPDGSIIIAGIGNTNRCIAAKFTRDGLLDKRFGVGGVSTVNVVDDDLVNAIYLQLDGKIVVGGRARDTGERFFLVRFNADGSLDQNFGTDGITQTLIEDLASLKALAMQNDGRIIAVGTSFRRSADPNGETEITLVRYHGDRSASIKERQYASIKCYPNPANTILNVSGINEECDYHVTSVTGIVVLQGKCGSNNSTINISSLPPGNYQVKLTNTQHSFAQQFVKN